MASSRTIARCLILRTRGFKRLLPRFRFTALSHACFTCVGALLRWLGTFYTLPARIYQPDTRLRYAMDPIHYRGAMSIGSYGHFHCIGIGKVSYLEGGLGDS
jgi:hypothetical protein